jgi:hypothetical protein
VGEEAHDEEEVQEAFRGRRVDGSFGVGGEALANPLERTKADLVVADVPRLGQEACVALGWWHRQGQAVVLRKVSKVPVVVNAVQIQQHLEVLGR